MDKMGKFKGIPVYRVSSPEWESMTTKDDERIYVIGGTLYYHDQRIAKLNNYHELVDFDEELFEHLKQHYERKRQEKKVVIPGPHTATFTAENVYFGADALEKAGFKDAAEKVRAQQSAKENTEPAAAVDEFMDSWLDNIEKELAILKQKELEYEACKVD